MHFLPTYEVPGKKVIDFWEIKKKSLSLGSLCILYQHMKCLEQYSLDLFCYIFGGGTNQLLGDSFRAK